MDELAYRSTLGTAVALPCIFERALLARCADCRVAARHALVVAAQVRHGSLSGIPWPGVVAGVVGWQGRRRRGGRE